jgi:sugar (glycoside-pentoside-hexuronide) transporter
VTGWLKVVLALLTYVGAGMAYTACSIAYQALQNVIAIDSRVRMNLATARGLGSQLIGIVLSLVAMPMILHFSQTMNAEGTKIADAKGYFVATVILSVLMIPLFWLCAAGCKETYTEKLHAGHQEKIGFFQSIKELVKNDQLLMVVLATVFGAICVSGRMGMLFYYIVYVVGGENPFALISPTFTTMTVAALIGVAILPWTTKWFGKRNWMLILNAVMVVGFILMFLFPTKTLLFPLSFICGVANSGANICPGMIGDSLEYGDWKLGKRQEGLVASFLSFGVKLATAFVGSIGVLLLSAVGYVPNAAQTPAACRGINIVVNIIPAVIGVLSMVPLFWYKLDDKRVSEIRADLEAGKHAWDK